MKHIKKYNESSEEVNPGINYVKDITKEDKEYFDIIFAEFIDDGAKSSLFESDISYHRDSKSVTKPNLRYRIDINLDGQYSNENKRLGGVYPVTSTSNGRVKDLIDYSKYMLDYTLEIESCINKIKIEYPYISNSIKSFDTSRLSPFKMSLFIYHS